jgi:hypothetical protein
MSGYNLVDQFKLDEHIWFFRINPTDISLTLIDVFKSLSDLCWIKEFDKEYIRTSFQVRAEATVKYISNNIIKENSDSITSDSGEYVISELARKTIVNELGYSNIPLGELIKEQKSGNPGFDFYTETLTNILLFGEAKYLTNQSAYGSAFKQIVRFEREKRDLADLQDIDKFCSEQSLNNVVNDKKGFIAAFSSKKSPTEQLVQNMKGNIDLQSISRFNEVICVAINI